MSTVEGGGCGAWLSFFSVGLSWLYRGCNVCDYAYLGVVVMGAVNLAALLCSCLSFRCLPCLRYLMS